MALSLKFCFNDCKAPKGPKRERKRERESKSKEKQTSETKKILRATSNSGQ